MATDANTLLSDARCFENCGPWELFRLGLLKQILLASDPVADTSPNALLESAKCYACMPPGLWMLLELGLLKQIADAGGVGGGGGVQCSAADPVAAPSGSCAFHYRTDTGAVWYWDGAAWQSLIV